MPGVVRLGDKCSGHGCHPPRPNVQGSPNVFICGLPAHRIGDNWASHRCGDNSHGGVTVRSSGTVFCNGMGLARVGDEISCGSFCAEGCDTVTAGD